MTPARSACTLQPISTGSRSTTPTFSKTRRPPSRPREPSRAAGGFRRGARTLWIAEGLFFYLTPPTVARLPRATAALSGAGSAIAADVSGTGLLRLPGMARHLGALEARGAPAPFRTDDPAALFRSAGWGDVELAEPAPLAAGYGRPPSPAPEYASRVTPIDPTMRTFFCVGRGTPEPPGPVTLLGSMIVPSR